MATLWPFPKNFELVKIEASGLSAVRSFLFMVKEEISIREGVVTYNNYFPFSNEFRRPLTPKDSVVLNLAPIVDGADAIMVMPSLTISLCFEGSEIPMIHLLRRGWDSADVKKAMFEIAQFTGLTPIDHSA